MFLSELVLVNLYQSISVVVPIVPYMFVFLVIVFAVLLVLLLSHVSEQPALEVVNETVEENADVPLAQTVCTCTL